MISSDRFGAEINLEYDLLLYVCGHRSEIMSEYAATGGSCPKPELRCRSKPASALIDIEHIEVNGTYDFKGMPQNPPNSSESILQFTISKCQN
jgi:hypothetical protein